MQDDVVVEDGLDPELPDDGPLDDPQPWTALR